MPLLRCPDCENSVSSEAMACPHCGRPSAISRAKATSTLNSLSFALAGVAVLFGLLGIWVFAVAFGVAAVILSIIYHLKRAGVL
jgi:hypothetical protein